MLYNKYKVYVKGATTLRGMEGNVQYSVSTFELSIYLLNLSLNLMLG